MKEKTQRRLRTAFITFMVICITPLAERGRMLSGARSNEAFAGKEMVCAIDLGDDMYGGHGLETGFNYELLSTFAKDNHCGISIVVAGKRDNYIDSLKQGKVDIVITHDKDSLEHDGIDILRQVHDCSVWAVNSTEENEIRQLNSWLSYISSSEDFRRMQSRYHNVYNPQKRAEKGIRTNTLSPYDDLIKECAAQLGWDWRMLAAVVYQESRFSIGSKSSRGASGLMQVMPQTGKYYGVEDLLDPKENLKAGTSHLRRLQNMFRKYGLSQDQLIKFTLAAYNAGEGRIMDCRNFAAAQQVDSTKWEEIVKIIPQMREDSILEDESVKLGKFQGHETIAYVDNVLSHYEAFCKICPSI